MFHRVPRSGKLCLFGSGIFPSCLFSSISAIAESEQEMRPVAYLWTEEQNHARFWDTGAVRIRILAGWRDRRPSPMALAAQKRAEEEAELARIRAEKARLAAEAKAREAQQRAAQAQYEAQEAQKGEHFEEEQEKGEMF